MAASSHIEKLKLKPGQRAAVINPPQIIIILQM